ncbi:hypothetical protein FSP39_001946 [Pinctada imbricata]|uniref:G-protein coupled receptors family 1 profile domain-containing protein n=1 Tax=Pinctada imbricata TaxID=66713 RepID=A0AA88Y2L0_PINIB|nr:hypothetical protein FSP39_001946 [Pinctada imbricata]
MDNATQKLTNELLTNEFIQKALLPNIVLYSTILVIGILGNIAVFVVYLTKMPRDCIKPRYFVPFLSFFDILVCTVSLTYFAVQTYVLMTFHQDLLCKLLVFLIIFTMMTSNSFLLAISVQRFTIICRPFGKQMTLIWRRISACLVIISGLFFAFPSLFIAGVAEFELEYKGVNKSGPSCFIGNDQYPMLQIIHNGLLTFIGTANIIVTTAMYTPIAILIFNKNKRNLSFRTNGQEVRSESNRSENQVQDHSEPSSSTSKENKDNRVNFNMMFLIIILVYIISYIPTSCVSTIRTFTEDFWKNLSISPIKYGVVDFFSKFYVCNHIANPFIYAYFDNEFRTCFKKILNK